MSVLLIKLATTTVTSFVFGQNKATALHVAAAEGNVDLCMMLLQADASIDVQDTVRAVRNACVADAVECRMDTAHCTMLYASNVRR